MVSASRVVVSGCALFCYLLLFVVLVFTYLFFVLVFSLLPLTLVPAFTPLLNVVYPGSAHVIFTVQ